MLPYSILMFVVSAIFIVFSILIYRGRTELIHSYHRENVTDRVGYGKAFGKALLVVAASPLVSGIIGLLGTQNSTAVAAVIVLIVGLVIGFTAPPASRKSGTAGYSDFKTNSPASIEAGVAFSQSMRRHYFISSFINEK